MKVYMAIILAVIYTYELYNSFTYPYGTKHRRSSIIIICTMLIPPLLYLYYNLIKVFVTN